MSESRCCAKCRRGTLATGLGPCGYAGKCQCHKAVTCTCTAVENPWTYYGIVEPGGALEPDMDCPVHFPSERPQSA